MGIMPYGYVVEDGIIRIDDETSLKVRKLFLLYSMGMTLEKAARGAGIFKIHTSVGGILSCRKYLGDGPFPQIIDATLFEAVQKNRTERSRKLGRGRLEKKGRCFRIGKRFVFKGRTLITEDPFLQAQAIYETIVEVL